MHNSVHMCVFRRGGKLIIENTLGNYDIVLTGLYLQFTIQKCIVELHFCYKHLPFHSMFVSLFQNTKTHAFDINTRNNVAISSYWTKQKQGCLIGAFQLPTEAVRKGSNGYYFVFTKSYVRMNGYFKKSQYKVYFFLSQKQILKDYAKTNGKDFRGL